MNDAIWMIPFGVAVGTIGSLIGVGGGFILMPLLMMIQPGASPEAMTGVSLAVVAMNAVSGSIAYARLGRVNYQVGLLFAVAGIPGVVLGTYVVTVIERATFDAIMGTALLTLAAFLFWKTRPSSRTPLPSGEAIPVASSRRTWLGALISSGVGFISSLLGIGGGVIHVPALVYLLGYSAQQAVATSQFVLACMATIATGIHAQAGVLNGQWMTIGLLGLGAIIGAQIGVRLSRRIGGVWIVRGLAVVLCLAGGRVVLMK